MDINSVSQRFIILAGIGEDELADWQMLIEDAICYVGSLLKDNVDIDTNLALLSSAAAAYAYYKWSIVTTDENTKSFTAGDLSISSGKSSDTENSAYKLWKNSLSEIRHLTEDSGFFFEGVRV